MADYSLRIGIIFINRPGYRWNTIFRVCSGGIYYEKGDDNGFITKHQC